MLGSTIFRVIEQLPLIFEHFCGVYTIDQIQIAAQQLKKYNFAVINTSVHPGQHWFLIYRNSQHYEIFDPLGYPSFQTKDVANYLKGRFIFNTLPVQPKNSKLCGEFCIIFIIHRLLKPHTSFISLVNKLFSKTDLKANNQFIAEYFSWLL